MHMVLWKVQGELFTPNGTLKSLEVVKYEVCKTIDTGTLSEMASVSVIRNNSYFHLDQRTKLHNGDQSVTQHGVILC